MKMKQQMSDGWNHQSSVIRRPSSVICLLVAVAVIAAVGVMIFRHSQSMRESVPDITARKSKHAISLPKFDRVKVIPGDESGSCRMEWTESVSSRSDIQVKPEIITEEVQALCGEFARGVVEGDTDKVIELGRKIAGLGDEAVAGLTELANCGDLKVELEALRLLSQIETPKAAAAALGKIINNADNEQLLKQFASIRTPAVVALLVKLMGSTNQPDLLESVRNILSSMEGDAVVDALLAGMNNPTDAYHRQDCAAIMSELSKPSNIPALTQVLEASDDVLARQAAATALAGIGNKDAVEVLAQHAENTPDDSEFSLDALSSVNSPYGPQAILDVASSKTYSQPVRIAAVKAAGNYNSSIVGIELKQRADVERDPEVRSAIAQSSGKVMNKTASRRESPREPVKEFVEGE